MILQKKFLRFHVPHFTIDSLHVKRPNQQPVAILDSMDRGSMTDNKTQHKIFERVFNELCVTVFIELILPSKQH